MDVDALLAQICALLQRQGRVSYWALKRRFDLSDEDIAGLKVELIEVQELAVDRDGKMLVWPGARQRPRPAQSSLLPPARGACRRNLYQLHRTPQRRNTVSSP